MHISDQDKLRFFSKVSLPGENGCMEWRAARFKNGYGAFGIKHQKAYYAHRIAWEIAYGSISKGLFVCHKCDNPTCVNPEHLFLGACADNARDMARKLRCGHNKLTTQDVLLIRKLRKSGASHRQLARQFGVNHGTISCILSGRSWAWLSDEDAA